MIHRLLKSWHKQIPAMNCESGCRECCEGYAPAMTLGEWRAIKHPGKIVKDLKVLATCPFLGDRGCEIYARRPLICRIFGTVSRVELEDKQVAESLPVFCPRGCQPAEPLRAGAALGLQVQYQQWLNREVTAVVADLRRYAAARLPGEAQPTKFEWMYYQLCTRDGQNNLRQLMGHGRPALAPEELGRLAAIIGG